MARKPHAIELIPKSITPVDVDEDFLYSMINQQYIDPLTQSEIQEKFEEESEIQLADFLPVSFLIELMNIYIYIYIYIYYIYSCLLPSIPNVK